MWHSEPLQFLELIYPDPYLMNKDPQPCFTVSLYGSQLAHFDSDPEKNKSGSSLVTRIRNTDQN